MSNIQNVKTQIPTTLTTQTGKDDAFKTTAVQQPAPLLGGASVTVLPPMGDLETLVARLKVENDDLKASLAKRRLTSVLDAYETRYGALSAEQTAILEQITNNNDAISTLMGQLDELMKELAKAQGSAAVMQAKIDSLERAVEQAVADGKAHRETVAKLKEQLAKDTENEDLKAQLAKEEAALALAETAIAKNEADLAAAQAAAGAVSAKIQSIAGQVESVKDKISALDSANGKLASRLEFKTVANLLSLFANEKVSQPSDSGESPAEQKKAEEKEIANDPARILREAMDRMDEGILKDIDENRDRNV